MNRLTLNQVLVALVFLSLSSLTGCYTQFAAGEASEYEEAGEYYEPVVLYIPYPVPIPVPVPVQCCDDEVPGHASNDPVKPDSGQRDFGSQRPSGESREDDRRGRRPGGR